MLWQGWVTRAKGYRWYENCNLTYQHHSVGDAMLLLLPAAFVEQGVPACAVGPQGTFTPVAALPAESKTTKVK
jgi:hypothetical protein